MPEKRLERTRQAYCEHEWKYTHGIDVTDNIIAAKVCIKCKLIVRLGTPLIDEVEPGWFEYWET